MIDIIKRIAADAGNGQAPLQLVEGVISSAPPNLKIKLKDNDKLIIPSELIMVSERLTKHSRVASGSNLEFTDELDTGDQVMVAVLQGGQSFFIIDRLVSYGE